MFVLELLELLFGEELPLTGLFVHLVYLLPTSSIPSSSGRFSNTVPPSVRIHGSKAARIRAPPFSIVDGPNNIVADWGGQSGVVVTAPA